MNTFRKELAKRRSEILQRDTLERALADRLKPFFHLIPDQKTAGYAPIKSEANPFQYLPEADAMLLPRVESSTRMVFAANENLAQSSMGILEPQGEEVIPDVLLIPLLGFQDTWRIGYGGGYYDRYLAAHPECLRIGIAFDEQQTRLDIQPWDEPLDYVVTPTRIIRSERMRNLQMFPELQ